MTIEVGTLVRINSIDNVIGVVIDFSDNVGMSSLRRFKPSTVLAMKFPAIGLKIMTPAGIKNYIIDRDEVEQLS